MKTLGLSLAYFLLVMLPFFELAAFAHSEGLPIGGKTIAGPGKEILELAKPAIVLQAQTPIPAACPTAHSSSAAVQCTGGRYYPRPERERGHLCGRSVYNLQQPTSAPRGPAQAEWHAQ